MTSTPQPDAKRIASSIFAACFGAFLGLSLLKFGNPPIMEKWVTRPTNALEFFLDCPWPIAWAYTILSIVVVVGLCLYAARRHFSVPRWVVVLPFPWLIWQFVAATQTVDLSLTGPTLAHFSACCSCFFLGVLFPDRTRLAAFWAGLIVAFLLVLA